METYTNIDMKDYICFAVDRYGKVYGFTTKIQREATLKILGGIFIFFDHYPTFEEINKCNV